MDKKLYFTPEAKFRAFIMKDIVATDGSQYLEGGDDWTGSNPEGD